MANERTVELERTVRVLEHALHDLVRDEDCREYLNTNKRPDACDCTVCEGKRALASTKNWRYIGAMYERVTNGHNSRETKMHAAWAKQVGDRELGLILTDERGRGLSSLDRPVQVPSARDWYVATSVVQWLATNVGMGVLEGAGFKYTQFEQDRAMDSRHAKERWEHERRQEKVNASIALDKVEQRALVVYMRWPPGTHRDERLKELLPDEHAMRMFKAKMASLDNVVQSEDEKNG